MFVIELYQVPNKKGRLALAVNFWGPKNSEFQMSGEGVGASCVIIGAEP